MKLAEIMRKIPKKVRFRRFWPAFCRFWPDFGLILIFFRNSVTFEPIIVEICMTTQIKAQTVYFQNMFLYILHIVSIFFNPQPKSAKNRLNQQNREIGENWEKLSKFGIFKKKSKIYIEIHILTNF